MPSSSSAVSDPMRLPVNATNSWVIRHARDLIDYDSYDVKKWLDEIGDDYDFIDEKYGGMNRGKFPDCDVGIMSAAARHPAGELEDYDPDHVAFSELSIIERLEAMAAELEAGDGGDNEPESSPSVTCPEGLTDRDDDDDGDDKASHDASSFSASSSPSPFSYSSFLPSGSLEGDSLHSGRSSTNPGSTVGSEISRVDEERSPASYPNNEPLGPPPSAPATAATQAQAAPRSSSQTLSSPISPSISPSQFLTVPHATPRAKGRARRSRRKLQHRRTRHGNPAPAFASAFTEARPHPLASEIPRGSSPVPSLRAEPRAAPERHERRAPGTPPALPSTAETQTKAKPRLRISKNVGGAPRPAPEIVRPQPQRAGMLFVPSPARTLFAASPFVVRHTVAQGEVPLVVVQEEEEEEEEEEEA